jgi:hypothetical protein
MQNTANSIDKLRLVFGPSALQFASDELVGLALTTEESYTVARDMLFDILQDRDRLGSFPIMGAYRALCDYERRHGIGGWSSAGWLNESAIEQWLSGAELFRWN